MNASHVFQARLVKVMAQSVLNVILDLSAITLLPLSARSVQLEASQVSPKQPAPLVQAIPFKYHTHASHAGE